MSISDTAQRPAQELHDAIVAHNLAMRDAMLVLFKLPLDEQPFEVLESARLICAAMAVLAEKIEPAEEA